ncbi:MAG: hypothetical protein H0V86_01900 [Chloroflexia bacterium]|nr:hypothetical protein [Chloroflexia bacterium]
MQLQIVWWQWLDWRLVITGLAGATGMALLIGIPTNVISNGYFTWMTPVQGGGAASLARRFGSTADRGSHPEPRLVIPNAVRDP